MRKKVALILAGLLLFTLLPHTAFAEDVQLTCTISKNSLTAGSEDIVEYIVGIPENSTIASIDITVHYDPALLEVESCEKINKDIDSSMINHIAVDKEVRYSAAHTVAIPLGDLFKISFKAKEGVAGETEISAEITNASDSANPPVSLTESVSIASQTISITKPVVPATGISIEPNSATVERDKTIQLTAKLDPENSTDTVEWSSKNEDIATVDEDGLVTGKKAGVAIITAKVKGSETLSAACTVTVTNPAISGELSISGNAAFGETLTASLSGYESGVTYTWYREGVEESIATGEEYTVVQADIGKTLTVKATHPDFVGTLEKSTGTVQKAQKAEKPDAPTAASKDYTSITLATVEGCEYKLGADGSWQGLPTFNGLTAETEYTFYIRYKETTTHLASEPASATIATKAYGAKDIAFTVKLNDEDAGDYGTYIEITGDMALTGTQEGTVTIAPKAGYYLSGIAVTGASPEYMLGDATDQAVPITLALSNPDQPATIAIDVKTKETQEITFKNDGVAVSGDTLTKDYDGSAFDLTAESTKGDVTITYYNNAGEQLEDAPVDAGTYTAKATAAGGVTYTDAKKTIELTINKASAGTAVAPQISDVTENGFTYTTVAGQKYCVTTSATAPDTTSGEWVDGTDGSVTRSDLEPGTTYYVYTFIPGDQNHTESQVVSASQQTSHTYSLEVTPLNLDFFARVGSSNVIEGKTITVKNAGTGKVTLSLNSLEYFEVTGLPVDGKLASGASVTLSVAPKGDLSRESEITYTDTLTITGTGETSTSLEKQVTLKFAVASKETVTFTGFADKVVTYGESYTMETAQPSKDVAVEYEYKKGTEVLQGAPTAAGTYTVTVKVPESNADYAGSASVTLTIQKKELTISGITVADKVYDGTVNATPQGGTLNGVVNGDTVNFTITKAEFNSKYVNAANSVTIVAALTGDAAVLANYTLTQPDAVSEKINPKPVTLNVTAADKVYDGTVNAVVNASFNADDLIEADQSSITVQVTSPVFADADAGENKTVTYSVQISGDAASNYKPSWPESVTANITQKPVTVTFEGSMSETYDGTAKTVSAALNGVLEQDKGSVQATVLYNGAAQAPVLAGDYVLTAELTHKNYKLDEDNPYTQDQAARTLHIAKGTLTPRKSSETKVISYLDTETYQLDLAAVFGTPVAGTFAEKETEDANSILAKKELVNGVASIAIASGKTVGQQAKVTYTFTPTAENTYEPIDLTLIIQVGTETVDKVEVLGAPATVEIGTALNMDAITLKVTYQSGRTETFENGKYTASGYFAELKPENVGTQVLTLKATSQGVDYTGTANIVVTDVLTGIAMETRPTQTEYTLGATGIDLAGGTVKLTYKSTRTETLQLSDSRLALSAVTAQMMRTIGTHTVTVSCTEGSATFETQFTFNVVSGATTNPDPGEAGPVIDDEDKFLTNPNDPGSVAQNVSLTITAPENASGIDAAIASEYPALVGNTQAMHLAFLANGTTPVTAQQSVAVQLPYPAGTDRAETFMLYLYQNGTLTPITPVKEANNLRFELPAGFSVSDAVLGWTKYVAPDTEEESAFDRAQDRFWGDVLRAIAFSDAGAVLTVDAGYFDKMPVEIMNAVNVRDVTLVIRWNHGDDIVISRANALTPEISRIYYPLSYLARTLVKIPAVGGGNIIFAPQTGDDWEITDWSMGMFLSPVSAVQPEGNAAHITLLDDSGAADLTWLGMLLLLGALAGLCCGWHFAKRRNGK